MYDLLLSAGLLVGGLVLALISLRLRGATTFVPAELAEMGTILFGVLLTALVSIGTALAFSGVHTMDIDGPLGLAAMGGIFVLPVLWLVLLGRIVRSFDQQAVPGEPDAPVNDNRADAPARRSAATARRRIA